MRWTYRDNGLTLGIAALWSIHFPVGYRDAECAWIPVQEDHYDEGSGHAQSKHTALFLVIYAPRRGILEVCMSEKLNSVNDTHVYNTFALLRTYPFRHFEFRWALITIETALKRFGMKRLIVGVPSFMDTDVEFYHLACTCATDYCKQSNTLSK